jgi:hypothetical protein
MLPITKILCPIDFSEASLETLQDAVEFAQHFNAHLVLVHVFETGSGIPPDPLYLIIRYKRKGGKFVCREVSNPTVLEALEDYLHENATTTQIYVQRITVKADKHSSKIAKRLKPLSPTETT